MCEAFLPLVAFFFLSFLGGEDPKGGPEPEINEILGSKRQD